MHVEETAAESAVRCLLRRVVTDINFRWYMRDTRTLELCIAAEADRQRVATAAVIEQMEVACDTFDRRVKRRTGRHPVPDVKSLRERVMDLEDELHHARRAVKADPRITVRRQAMLIV